MARKGCLFVCLFITVCLRYHVLGQVSSLCRPNERLLTCGGCQKTCMDPVPVCTGVCNTGCYCNEGEVRNATGHCVKLSECPPMLSSYLQTSEPRSTDTECPENEEYRFCEPCNRTCDNPNPICPAQCARGCYCIDDLVRERDGRCVKQEHCSNLKKNESSSPPHPVAYQLTCGPHQTYKHCQECERTCSNPQPVCHTPCSTGCFCDDGFLKSPSGQCVKLEDCPKAEVSLGLGAHEPSVEDCQSDEVYLLCGWCEPSCSEPRPSCPAGVCTRGCLCRPPLLRHHSGQCVTERDCIPQKCSSPNEEFVCRYGCEASCDPNTCVDRARRCILGCHCKLGLLRDPTGKCVTPDDCPSQSTSNSSTKVNGSSYKYFDDISPRHKAIGVDVRAYMEAIKTNKNFMEAKSSPTSAEVPDKHKPVKESDQTTPKTFNDVVSLARRFYKGFPNVYGSMSPLHRDVDLRIPHRFDKSKGLETSYRTLEIIPGNTYTRDDVPREYDNSTSEEAVNATDSNKGSDGYPATPFKDANLNAYLRDILSVMKDMMPEPMNFTIINYPMW